jgi:molecular chaperone HscB
MGIKDTPLIDQLELENHYLKLQARVHPDRFVDPVEKQAILAMSEKINIAYKILKDDFNRRVYLLELAGIVLDAQQYTGKLEPEFLEEVFEERALIEQISDTESLNEKLQYYLEKIAKTISKYDQLFIDKNLQKAAIAIMKVQYYTKIKNEIEHKIAVLEEVKC